MGWVTLGGRQLYLQRELNDIQWQIDQIARQKMSLHKYASTLSDGKIGFMELAGMPYEHLGMALSYMLGPQRQAAFSALNWASTCFNWMQQSNPNTPMMPSYGWLMYQKALEARLEQARKAEEERIKQIEEQLDHKMEQLKTRQKVVEGEYKSVEEGVGKAIERTTPKYA